MRLTIIRDDAVVGINGEFRSVDLSGLDPVIRAVQWNDERGGGHIEYDDEPNANLDNINDFQSFIDLWTAAAPPNPSNPPEFTPAESIAAAHARINRAYEIAVNALTAGYPENEIASWPKQEAEARAWLAEGSALTPWIDSAATARGISKPDFVNLIITNANALAPLHGALSGKRQYLRDQIDALGNNPTAEQLNTIQW